MPRAIVLLVMVLFGSPAQGQWEPTGGAAGDFRSPDRPIGTPSLRAPETAGFPSSDGMKLLEGIGPKPPSEVFKQLDKDLAKSPKGEAPPGRPRGDREAAEHLEKRPAAPVTIK